VGVTLYPAAHLVKPDQVLFLALMTSDNKKAIFYVDLLLVQ